MKYMGSKSKVSKYIVPIIQKEINEYNIQTYIEPFCGGCNIIDKIDCENKIASDKHQYLIELFKNIDKLNTLPEFITRDHYSDVRDSYNYKKGNYPDWYIGAVGFLSSYNGRFFDGGYSGIVTTKYGNVRNYYDEAKRNLIEQSNKLNDVKFECNDYKHYSDYTDCLFYLDPPYNETKQYGISKDFNYEEFWNWVRMLSKKNIVFISEHAAPNDFECIWSAPVKRTIDNNKRVLTVEKLFKLKEINK